MNTKKNKIQSFIISFTLIGSTIISCQQKAIDETKSTEAGLTILATPAQVRADSLSVVLLKNESIKLVSDSLLNVFLADSVSKSDEGITAAKNLVQNIALASIQSAISETNTDPQFLWIENAAHQWHGLDVPSAKWAIDNPDNIYRSVILDSASAYEIHVRHPQKAPVQESFEVTEFSPENPSASGNLSFLRGNDIKQDANGSYIVTVSSESAKSSNHIQITKPLVTITYRNTLSNWGEQLPAQVEIKKISGPNREEVSNDILVKKTLGNLKFIAGIIIKFRSFWMSDNLPANSIGKPYPRDGGWGFVAGSHFDLAEDEALIVKVNPKSAKYVGFQLTDVWMISPDYVNYITSLNNSQAKADKDGNITYVVAAKNPGVVNWLDNRGLRKGGFTIRWQLLPDGIKSIDDAIIQQRVVKTSSVPQILKGTNQELAAADYQKTLEDRKNSYQQRLGVKN